MACRMKEDNNIIGYIEIPEDYWIVTTTADTDNPNLYWHNGKND